MDRSSPPPELERAPRAPSTSAGTSRATTADPRSPAAAAEGEGDHPIVGGGPSDVGDSRGDAASIEGVAMSPSMSTSRHPLPDLQAIGDSVIEGIRLLAAHQAAATNRKKNLAARQDAADKRESLLAAQGTELLARAERL